MFITLLVFRAVKIIAFPSRASDKKKPACQCRRHKRRRFDPCVGKIPWRIVWQPTPVFLPGESYDWGVWQPPGSIASQRVRHDSSNLAHTHAWRWLVLIFQLHKFLDKGLETFKLKKKNQRSVPILCIYFCVESQ